jgi:hypothetical protein
MLEQHLGCVVQLRIVKNNNGNGKLAAVTGLK